MKNSVLKGVVLAMVAVLTLGLGVAHADATYTVDPGALVNGYMNVFDLSNNFLWGSGWGPADLTATWSGSDVTLGPNCIGDPNEYWYLPSGGPGAVGQKLMEANLYAQVDDGSLAGQNVTFQGFVLSNTLTSAHTAVAFVKDFAGDWSSFQIATVPLPVSGARPPIVAVGVTDLFGNAVLGPYDRTSFTGFRPARPATSAQHTVSSPATAGTCRPKSVPA